METKFYDKNCITLDGRMDEPVWETAKEYTNFTEFRMGGGALVEPQTSFKILPCEDRIFVGVKCYEPEMEEAKKVMNSHNGWGNPAIEIFFSPTGTTFDFYHFFISMNGVDTITNYYEEGGNITPDRYAPDWKSAVYYGEDYWSVEAEFPLTAFYMTVQNRWNDTWLFNIGRSRTMWNYTSKWYDYFYSTWSPLYMGFKDVKNFNSISGFPMRRECDDVCIHSATAKLEERVSDGYRGTMNVRVNCSVGGDFIVTTDHSEPVQVTLQPGTNEVPVPCHFADLNRYSVALGAKRISDGVEFKRHYPVTAVYEPIKLHMTLPEYRNNFYPGQDYSKVVGTVTATKAVTVMLEGPGIETQVITPDAEGNFTFETPNFQEGTAILTVSTVTDELVKKIRRLPPSKHMMTWISGGNLIVNGKPVMRRDMFSPYYAGGVAFQRRYDADNLYITKELKSQVGGMQPGCLIGPSEQPGGEATKDGKPSEEMLRKIDELIEKNADSDFAYYYISDEPECRGLSTIYFEHLYEYVAEKDPYHVLLSASRDPNQYLGIADWFENHAYINPFMDENGKRTYARTFNTLGGYVDKISSLNLPDKCGGFMPTFFSNKGSSPLSDYPTLEELICHTWAGMIHGAKSVCPYAYHDVNDRPHLYEGARFLFSSLEAVEDIMLFAERTQLARTDEYEVMHYDYNGEKMFVLVNFIDAPQRVTVENLSGEWYNFRHEGMITGNTFDLKPFEVVIGTSKKRDAGLPTYEEVAALVDKLEYERTHRRNLLFDRQQDIEFSTSGVVRPHKLFDGVRDNYAWSCNFGDKFLELDLTKVKPTFNTVIVYGYNIEDMTLQVRNNDELSVPAMDVAQTDEYAITFTMKEAISPDCLRFEFPKDRVEVYEIEVF